MIEHLALSLEHGKCSVYDSCYYYSPYIQMKLGASQSDRPLASATDLALWGI